VSDPEAKIRAGITKVVLGHRASLDPSERERFEAAVGLERIREIEAKFNTTMIPTAEHVEILDALREIIGSTGLQRYFAEAYVLGLSQIPLLKGLVEATIRSFGASPGHLAKVMPRAWRSLSVATGEFEVEVDDASKLARLHLRGIDPALATSGSYADTFAGTFMGFLRQCGVEGEVTITSLDPVAGEASFMLRWG
jgi:hypothetical protein